MSSLLQSVNLKIFRMACGHHIHAENLPIKSVRMLTLLSLQATDTMGKVFFEISIIFFDLCYDSVKNEVLFVKIGARILDLRPDTPFGISV